MIRDLNTWAESLIASLQHHMDAERGALTQYGHLAASSPDDHVRFLMRVILEDEVRHHGFFADMIQNLRAEMASSGDGGLPKLRPASDRTELRAQTSDLLELERNDIKELRELKREISKVADTSWWTVLIDAMEADNQKHIRLLEFIHDHA